MKKLFLFSALLSALVFSSGALQCQQLTVQTDSGKQMVLNRTDLEGLPHVKVTASEHSSGPVNFEGVTVKSVLEKAGVTFGESMRGKRLTNCLLVEAADGYRVVIALQSWTRLSLISRPCWLSCGMGNHSVKKKGHTELSSRMKNEWHDGSGRLRR
jgi:hypothetical protein